jgi:hypothetical protein
VVGNTMQQALDAKPRLHVYRALEQHGQPQLEVATLSATAFAATSIPAWRATHLDVAAVLRDGS